MTGTDRRRASRLAIGVGIVLVAAATSLAAVSDAWITTKTKIALLTTLGVEALDVNVDTIDRHMTLHGTVASSAARRRSGEVARDVEGVAEVQNLLQVVVARRQAHVEARDEDLAERVTATLREHGGPGSARVRVVSVNAGVVLLGGTAPSMSAHLGAIVTASRVPGVRRIETEVQAPGELEENEVYHLEPHPVIPVPRGLDG
jgi:osmotically-inducible protein OsmY